MIGAPPVVAGAVQETLIRPLAPVAWTLLTGPGTVRGVTDADSIAVPVPATFTAATRNM